MAKAVFGEYSAFTTRDMIRFQKNKKLVSEKAVPAEVVGYLKKQLSFVDKPKTELPPQKFAPPTEEQKAKLRAESLETPPELSRSDAEMEAARPPEPVEDPLTPDDFDEPTPAETPLTTEPIKKAYTVVPNELGGGVEYPRGVVHDAGATIFLTDDEAKGFAPGIIQTSETLEPEGSLEPADNPPETFDTSPSLPIVKPMVDPDFLESVSIHTAPLEIIAEALYNRFGLYSVYLNKLPEADEINPLTGELFTKYHHGIAYQAAIRAQNTGILNRPAETGRAQIDEGRKASEEFQVDAVPETMGQARRADSFAYRTSVGASQGTPTTQIVHERGADGELHAVQKEIQPGETGLNNGARARYDKEEDEVIVEPQFGKPVIRPKW